ncbi:hypothetical protein T492DRAFT_847341 [Pavlovales sp. CCMP2436]|nr:hypothetical protein T492DRAFT_847341 [Pavlovales sp. CCMP2436]
MYMDVHGTYPPKVDGSNKFVDPGPPPKIRMLPATMSAFDNLYNKMLVDGRRQEKLMADKEMIWQYSRNLHDRGRNRIWETNTDPLFIKDKSINVDHIGLIHWLTKSSTIIWERSIRKDVHRPTLDKGIKYFIEIFQAELGDHGGRWMANEQLGGFYRSVTVVVNRPSDLENIVDLRYTDEEAVAAELSRDTSIENQIRKEEGRSVGDSSKTAASFLALVFRFTEVTEINGVGPDSTNLQEIGQMYINTSPDINCVVKIIHSRFRTRLDEIATELEVLPAGTNGRNKVGVTRDVESYEEAERAASQPREALGINKHLIASGVAYIEFTSPLQRGREVYWRCDHPKRSQATEHGVQGRKNYVVTSEATIKLTELEMKARLEELTESGEMCIVTPSNSSPHGQMIRTLNGFMYRLHTVYNEWSDKFWKPQIDLVRLNSDHYGLATIAIVLASPQLTGRARFEPYESMAAEYATKDKCKIQHPDILNIDQSLAYTRHNCESVHAYMGTPGKTCGKMSEGFLIKSRAEMLDMLG